MREEFDDPVSGLGGTRYNVTLGYTIGDVASLTVVSSGLAGVGIDTTVLEVNLSGIQACVRVEPNHPTAGVLGASSKRGYLMSAISC